METDRVNLNKADWEKLSRLGGIGHGLAKELVRYRLEHGGFKSTEEIREVPGFDDVVAEKLRHYVFVREG